MQTRKKCATQNTAIEDAGSKPSRQQKKTTVSAEKKVTELITSSARKQRPGLLSKKTSRDEPDENNTNTGSLPMKEESQGHLPCDGSIDTKRFGESDSQCVLDTLFSPKYHLPHDFCGGISDKGMLILAILIFSRNFHSKLECLDEPSHDPMATDGMDSDELDEFDDFNPYAFIKNLPDLSAIVPTFRPCSSLNKLGVAPRPPLFWIWTVRKTLVHSSLEPCDDADFTFPVKFNFREHTIYVRCRPHLRDFMERVSTLFEIIIFTASQSIYAEQLLNVLDPKRKLFRHRVYRESCLFVEGNYVKDLSVLGRDLARVIIVDNSPQAFGFQVDNGIPIESWFDDRSDKELLSLLPFLESLVGVEDVRPLIANKFNLRQKIAAAI
ncbi:unnamed protein product [Spirodela intermedia]|uniref:FCP1 homology domain-containing protein n=1 Tax=Spirodela intermedia TaxID=51605 RepID=A0A7I8IPU9_SPIIN|nr:unnamed protein product [Spirodela intermedia]CAA6659928.1 unnamed protein product [Spirodela intermedia]